MQFHIVLHQPRIPQNTGNIGRLCFASNTILHLIYPLGFSLTQKELKRAGMDYWEHLEVYEYADTESFFKSYFIDSNLPHFFLTTKTKIPYYKAPMQAGAYLHFGREDAGLSQEILSANQEYCYTIPMQNNARSLNLATSVGIVLYEGIRQASL
ncbi:tRNA (cytidine(34)-2'-O)-methyltransferase [Helicobacter winghamensis]|uniref:Putative tRNA (cytidine(34)-2'-O)-methyltransferase n=1 Tax=Helicobacter winghamensis TaxID=157268 RepID=A0A2N3PHY0_9HELI|nr:tRNA (cytidine(34)-2'-O)-methyltransferase [Helicobacter winghamensis]EEO26162.1 putative RNA methyltransferase, TrmH family, group 2 [Helicobacter winghamensis ATCC BAA-430]PKT75699.1 RNA methyltransferase [Helicobacter winghamensis]PKT75908.1 RNA methyltransferase [Helicobacter winghamensis]PKT76145.1 RNA methyltransferase [Helicobacter winghamensis]PKT80291.1 RNA methyltransferase [Helicobacter winghamensis]